MEGRRGCGLYVMCWQLATEQSGMLEGLQLGCFVHLLQKFLATILSQ